MKKIIFKDIFLGEIISNDVGDFVTEIVSYHENEYECLILKKFDTIDEENYELIYDYYDGMGNKYKLTVKVDAWLETIVEDLIRVC